MNGASTPPASVMRLSSPPDRLERTVAVGQRGRLSHLAIMLGVQLAAKLDERRLHRLSVAAPRLATTAGRSSRASRVRVASIAPAPAAAVPPPPPPCPRPRRVCGVAADSMTI